MDGMLVPKFDQTFSEKLLSNQKIEGQCQSLIAKLYRLENSWMKTAG